MSWIADRIWQDILLDKYVFEQTNTSAFEVAIFKHDCLANFTALMKGQQVAEQTHVFTSPGEEEEVLEITIYNKDRKVERIASLVFGQTPNTSSSIPLITIFRFVGDTPIILARFVIFICQILKTNVFFCIPNFADYRFMFVLLAHNWRLVTHDMQSFISCEPRFVRQVINLEDYFKPTLIFSSKDDFETNVFREQSVNTVAHMYKVISQAGTNLKLLSNSQKYISTVASSSRLTQQFTKQLVQYCLVNVNWMKLNKVMNNPLLILPPQAQHVLHFCKAVYNNTVKFCSADIPPWANFTQSGCTVKLCCHYYNSMCDHANQDIQLLVDAFVQEWRSRLQMLKWKRQISSHEYQGTLSTEVLLHSN